MTRIGFVGFGEAGVAIASGLHGAGARELAAFDVAASGDRDDVFAERAQASGVALLDDLAMLVEHSDVVLSLVTARVALQVARDAAAGLREGQLFVDLNSLAPGRKGNAAHIVEERGARFVDAAIMTAVPPHRHRVPILLSGSGAAALRDCMEPYGMRLEVLNDQPGTASAVKLCRSLLVKGVEALLWDSLLVADQYGAAARVLASVGDTLHGDWEQLASYLMGRTVLHGPRRAAEMDEAARMVADAGFGPGLGVAIADRLRAVAAMNPDMAAEADLPADYAAFLRTFDESNR